MADVRVKKEVEGAVAEGSAVAGNPVQIGLDDGANVIRAQATAAGELKVSASGSGNTDLGKVEDVAHTTADVGVMALSVRNDTLSSLVDSDGDYAPLQVTVDGALHVHSNNLIDSNNSDTTPLGISGTFTGTGTDVSQYSNITVMVDSTHDSATDGMTFQFSIDNSNWDDIYLFTYTAANDARRFQFPVTGQYFRVVYTNGGTGQTTFRLQTILHDQPTLTTIHRLIDNMDPDRSAQLMKTVIIAQAAGAGDFVPVQATASGNLKMSIEEADTSASGLAKAESAAHTDGDVGVMALAVRNDDLADLGGVDGDYSPLQVTQNGALLICPAANDDYKYAVIDAALSGDNTIVTAVASRKIRVLALYVVAAGTTTARFESGAAGTALSGQMNLIANSGFSLDFNPAGWFETGVNTLLNLELSAAISVDGSLTYIEVL